MTSLSIVLVINDASLQSGAKRCLGDLPVRVLAEESTIADWDEFRVRLDTLSADVLVLDLGTLGDETIERVMERVRSLPRPPSVVALHMEANPDVILRTIRAGAVEYCYAPVERPLRAALEKLLKHKAESAPARGRGKAIGFLSVKGGCGATTIACHVATALPGLVEDKVLMADFDIPGGLVSFLMKSKTSYSVLQAMQNSHRLDESYWQALISNGIPRLDILTAPTQGQRQALPVERLGAVVQFARSLYGYSVIDLGRFLTASAAAAVIELDQTLLVTTLDVLALHHARNTVEQLLDMGYPRERMGLVINRATSQREIDPEDVEKLLGVPIASVLPEDAGAIAEAYPEGRLLAKDSKLYLHIQRLAKKLAGVQDVQQKKKFLFFGS